MDFSLTDDDMRKFLAGAKQRTYKKGEYVLTEGDETSALYHTQFGRPDTSRESPQRSHGGTRWSPQRSQRFTKQPVHSTRSTTTTAMVR